MDHSGWWIRRPSASRHAAQYMTAFTSIFGVSLRPLPRFRFYNTPRSYLEALISFLTGRVHAGDHVVRLEADLSARLGVEHAIAVPQCRVGIYLAIKNLVRPGQNVILSPYTIYDVVNMVLCAGGVPVFADIEKETCNIDIESVRSLVDSETSGVIITHLHGLMADAPGFKRLCEAHGLWLLEDAAQAYGTRLEGRMAGTFGDVGAYSFGRAKNVNAFFGGAVVTNDTKLAAAIREDLAGYPMVGRLVLLKRIINCLAGDIMTRPPIFQIFTFWLFRYGCLNDVAKVNKIVDTEDNPVRRDAVPQHYLRRITPLQARLVARQLDAADRQSEMRIATVEIYHDALKDLPTMVLPPRRDNMSHIYLAYPIQIEDRWDMVKHIMRSGCDVSVQHCQNTADLECFRDFHYLCPVARRVSAKVVLLPTYPAYSRAEARRLAAVVQEYFNPVATYEPNRITD